MFMALSLMIVRMLDASLIGCRDHSRAPGGRKRRSLRCTVTIKAGIVLIG